MVSRAPGKQVVHVAARVAKPVKIMAQPLERYAHLDRLRVPPEILEGSLRLNERAGSAKHNVSRPWLATSFPTPTKGGTTGMAWADAGRRRSTA